MHEIDAKRAISDIGFPAPPLDQVSGENVLRIMAETRRTSIGKDLRLEQDELTTPFGELLQNLLRSFLPRALFGQSLSLTYPLFSKPNFHGERL